MRTPLRITLACSDELHPVNAWIERWLAANSAQHEVRMARKLSDLSEGDLLFLISFHARVPLELRARFRSTLVLHASDLPSGRGWSPHVWRILEGKDELVVTMLEAVDAIDAGAIWAQERIRLEGHELFDEINSALFDAELRLLDIAVAQFGNVNPAPQVGEPSAYRRRTPADSRLDVQRSIAEQFDLLRVCDPVRFPAFFEFRGHKYRLRIDKID